MSRHVQDEQTGPNEHRDQAWGDLLTDLVPGREYARPRRRGITMILDRCQGLVATKDLLDLSGNYVDHIKLSFGTSVLLSKRFIQEKNELIRSYNIDIYPGGTLTEAMLLQGVYPQYLQRAITLGFTAVEISDGTITMGRQTRSDAIRRALDSGLKVITEVGKKDPTSPIPVLELCDQIHADLACGAAMVIVEARESGTGIGIYDTGGAIRTDMLTTILSTLGNHAGQVMWEAPRQSQQANLIVQCGPNVSLGNVKPRDVLGLEALRRGLRYETFRHFASQLRQDGAIPIAQSIDTPEITKAHGE
ncbi:MAG: phosphosulfolactate synthase [Herpetosiphon sp.]